MSVARESVVEGLQALLRPQQVVVDPIELITYELDASLDRGRPDAVVFPESAADVARVVRWARAQGVPLVARGAGTGLSGGAVPLRGGIVLAFARMQRILALDAAGLRAVVEPGVVNQVLDQQARARGLYYPPDPASGRSSTIGGNVASNAGGPHCFKYGVTTNYVTGLEVVLADGRTLELGGQALDYPGYDLCGLITGSEGTLAVITQATVRLAPNPPGVKTLMASFDSVEIAGEAVSAVIAAGLVPGTLEMMDQKIMRIIEDYVHAGLPLEAGAALIVEVDGYPASLDAQMEEITRVLRQHGALDLRVAETAAERDKIWYGRKSAAGAMSRLAPAYYLVDVTVPRSRLAQTLAAVNRICETHALRVGYVFHAGDGNLHPLILMEPDDPDEVARVHRAGREIAELCVPRQGSISGEHGVGIEKRDYMALMYTPAELSAMWDVKQAFDPDGVLNPDKVFPAHLPPVPATPAEAPGERLFAPATAEAAARGLAGLSAARRSARIVGSQAPADGEADVVVTAANLTGITTYALDDLYLTAGAGTRLTDVQARVGRDRMLVPLVSPWREVTLGGLVATNVNGPLRMRYGGVRDLVLAATVVLADGRTVRAGRPVVKNVAGYDLPKVLVGSQGTLGLITDVTLRLTPQPRARRTLLVAADDLTQALRWGQSLLPTALVASAVVVCQGGATPLGDEAPYALVYTAEGLPGDVTAELEAVRRKLGQAGTPQPLAVESPSGTDVWAYFLQRPGSDALVVRIGVPPGTLVDYTTTHAAALLGAANLLVDAAAGLAYAVATPALGQDAATWLADLQRTARDVGGYSYVLAAPAELGAAVDAARYRPAAVDVMQRLKDRWDPMGILPRGILV